QACEWVFLSALLKLQERARNQGANAVINIKSNYKNNEVVSDTEYQCGAGTIFAGVALKGRIVKLAK
ncbi:MAG: excinuclease ABC subunit A, partial [Desulfobacterales bacterium]|nr:excinuclease ABC subunit A [Desulfobacterales bacterium]